METDEAVWSEYEDGEASAEDAALERAWEAIDAGDHERAVLELDVLDPDWPDRWIPEAIARTELGELERARALLTRVEEFADAEEDLDYLWARAQLYLCEWRVDDAQATLELLLKKDRSAPTLERLSLCSDLRGDFDRADGLMADAAAIDAERFTLPPRLASPVFGEIVSEAIGELPPEFQAPLETTEVIVEPMPAEWMVDRANLGETPPDLLGLFVGASELDRSSDESALLPRRIFLFQRNLERATRSHDELVEEIRITLFHEIAHMLGFDEEGVADLGLS